jgi:heptosyltransferase-2
VKPVAIPSGGFRAIAVLRLSSLGDIVLTLPVVHALARAYPEARLTYWTKEEYQDAVRFDPAIHHVRVLEREARKIEDLVSMSAELEESDLLVDLHGNMRTRVLTFRQRAPMLRAARWRFRRAMLVHARALKPKAPPTALERYARALAPIGLTTAETPRLSVGEEAERWADEWLASWLGDARPIAMLPGARHFTKRWPERHWLALHERLREAGHALLYASLASERAALPELAARVEEDGMSRWCLEPLPRIGALLSRARTAVSSDSGLMHVAAARGCRVVAMFGSTAPELGFAPVGDGHVVLCRHEPCQPCTLHGRERCPKGHFRCMNELRPETVGDAVASIVDR